jgi:hypothetical protein
MKPKKQKANEPSLLDQLNGPLRDFVADIREHGVSTFQRLREESAGARPQAAHRGRPGPAAGVGAAPTVAARALADLPDRAGGFSAQGKRDDLNDGIGVVGHGALQLEPLLRLGWCAR